MSGRNLTNGAGFANRNLTNTNVNQLSDITADLPVIYDTDFKISLKGLNSLGASDANKVIKVNSSGNSLEYATDNTIDLDTTTSYSSQAPSAISFGNATTLRDISMNTGELTISSGNGSNGDCKLILEADTNNSVETSNPEIVFKSDGGTTSAYMYLDNNDLMIRHFNNYNIQLGGNYETQLKLNSGDVEVYKSILSVSSIGASIKPELWFSPNDSAENFSKYIRLQADIIDSDTGNLTSIITLPRTTDTLTCNSLASTLSNKTIYNAIYDGDAGANSRLRIQDYNKSHTINILAQDLTNDINLTLGDTTGTIAIQDDIPTNGEIRALFSGVSPISYNNSTGAISTTFTNSSSDTLTNKSGNISMWTNNESYIKLTSLSASSPLSYNNSTGAFTTSFTSSSSDTLTNKSGNISQWTNNEDYIKLTSLSASSPLSYNNTTGAFTTTFTNSSSDTLTNKSGNISMWTNNESYIKLTNLSASAPLSYNNTTGAFTTTFTSSSSDTLTNKSGNISMWTNNENYIKLTSLSGVSPISYNNSTGAISTTFTSSSSDTLTNKGGNISMWTNNEDYIKLTSLSASSPLSYNNTTGAFTTTFTNSSSDTLSNKTLDNAIFTGTSGDNARLTIKDNNLDHNAIIKCINFTADRTFYFNDDGGTILTSNTTSPNVSQVQNYSNNLTNGTTINFGSGGTSTSSTTINNITFGCANTFTFGSGKGANGDCVLNIVADTDDDNSGENSNPELRLTADGGGNVARFYLDNNDLMIIHEDNYDIQLGANNETQLKLNSTDVEVYKSDFSISSTGASVKPVCWFVPNDSADNFSKYIKLVGDIVDGDTDNLTSVLTLPRTTATLATTTDLTTSTNFGTSASGNITIGVAGRTITMNATNYTYNDTDGTSIFTITNSDVEINGADFGIKARSSSIPPAIYFWDHDKTHYVSLKSHSEIASSVVLTLPHITATLAYAGQNVSDFTNDAGYLTNSSTNISTNSVSGNPQRNFGNTSSQALIQGTAIRLNSVSNTFHSGNATNDVFITSGDTSSDSYVSKLTFYTKGNTKNAQIFKNTGDEFVIKNADERLELGGENDIQLKLDANDVKVYKSDFTISAYTASAYPRIFFLPNTNADNYTNRICLNSYQYDGFNNGQFDVFLLPFNSDLCQSRSGTSSTRYLNFWTNSNTSTKLRQDVYGNMSEGANGSDSGNRAYSFSVRSTGVSSSYFPYIYNQSNADGKHSGWHTNGVADNFMVEQGQDIRYYNCDLIGDTNTGHGYSKLCLGDIYCGDIFADDVKSDGVLLTSDRRLKKDIKPIENALSTINKLECKTFLKKVNTEDDIWSNEWRLDSGFIAQDLYNDVPELQHIVNGVETDISSNFVNGKLIDDCVGYKIIQTSTNTCVPCDLDPSGNANPNAGEQLTESTYEKVLDPNKRLSLNYEEIIPYTCKAIQELDAIIKQQQTQISQQQIVIDKLLSSSSFKEFKSNN